MAAEDGVGVGGEWLIAGDGLERKKRNNSHQI